MVVGAALKTRGWEAPTEPTPLRWQTLESKRLRPRLLTLVRAVGGVHRSIPSGVVQEDRVVRSVTLALSVSDRVFSLCSACLIKTAV